MWHMRNVIADWLYDGISEHVLTKFVDACREPSDHSFTSVLGSLLLLSAATHEPSDLSLGFNMQTLVEDTTLVYRKMRDANPTAYLTFLPIPDDSKSARKIWMLPNLSSLTNLYARINKYHRRKLDGIMLVHDHQMQLDDILIKAKLAAETIVDKAFTPHSDYSFEQTAGLRFAGSDRSVGIQCADVVAGTVMRYFWDNSKKATINADIEPVMKLMLGGRDTNDSFGIIQVAPTRMVITGS